VHAKGAAAHGYFQVTHDVTKYTKARVFEAVGKKTPVFARFSTVAGEKGSCDTERDPRGNSDLIKGFHTNSTPKTETGI